MSVDGQGAAAVVEPRRLQRGAVFGLQVAIVADGIRATSGAERSSLRARFIFVIKFFVGRFCIEIDAAGAGRSRWRSLIGEVKRATGKIAEHRSAAVDGEIAGKAERESADGSREGRIGGIAGQNDVGNLFGGDAGAADFDHVLARCGVEKIIAEAVAVGGIGERLGESGVRINLRERSARLPAGRHAADPDGSSGKGNSTRVKYDVVLARALPPAGIDDAGYQMQQQRKCRE